MVIFPATAERTLNPMQLSSTNEAFLAGCMLDLLYDPDNGGNISFRKVSKPTRFCNVTRQEIVPITVIADRISFRPHSQNYHLCMCFLCRPPLIMNIKRQFRNMWDSWGLLYQCVNQFQCHQSWLQNNLMCNTEASVLLSYIKLCKYGL